MDDATVSTTESFNNTWEMISGSSTHQQRTATEVPTPEISWDDATWILASSFIIFTMQSGMSECVSFISRMNNFKS